MRTCAVVVWVCLGCGFTSAAAQSVDAPAQAATVVEEPADPSFDDAVAHGVEARTAGRIEAAAQHFRRAMEIQPSSAQAHYLLAEAYGAQVVPNLDTPENLQMANAAISLFREVPESDAHSTDALRETAALLENTKRLDEAKREYLRVLARKADDAAAHYAIGVIDWRLSYANVREVLAKSGLSDDGQGNVKLPPQDCTTLRAKNAELVSDGLKHLGRAIEIQPDNDEAMQYMNLTLRRDADLACGNETRRASDLKQADQWAQEGMRTRNRKEAKGNAH